VASSAISAALRDPRFSPVRASERKRESHIPVQFWWMSIVGGAITTAYAIHRRDPVFIVGQSAGLIVYIRNLMLIYARRKTAEDTAQDRA
jgi:lipid-A-disaccharide synthase-like uncharacterized protein